MAYADRLDSLKLWTLEERRVRADLIEVYKIVHGLSAIPFSSFFEFENSGRTRGLKLWKKRCHLDLRIYFFSERVVSLWNCLDERTVKSASLNCFKGNLTRLRSSTMGQLFLDSFVRWPQGPRQLHCLASSGQLSGEYVITLAYTNYSTVQTKLRVALVVSSQSSSTCRVCRARRAACCSTSSTQPKCMAFRHRRAL